MPRRVLQFIFDDSVVARLQNVRIIGENACWMQHNKGFVFCMKTLVRVSFVAVELVAQCHLRIKAACQNDFEQIHFA